MIILASKSPRRRQLLSMMGLDFIVQTADIDETMDKSQTPAHEVAAVSARKVYTGLTVHADGESKTQVVGTDVTFRELTDAEIAAYIETKEPMDKAGSYGIQGYGSMFVSHLDGDYFCVMGLPVCTLAGMLRSAGVEILGQI